MGESTAGKNTHDGKAKVAQRKHEETDTDRVRCWSLPHAYMACEMLQHCK